MNIIKKKKIVEEKNCGYGIRGQENVSLLFSINKMIFILYLIYNKMYL